MTHSRCSAAVMRRYAKLSMAELQEARIAIEKDPKSANPEHANGRSIYIYTAAAREKLEAIAWAITSRLAEKRRTAG